MERGKRGRHLREFLWEADSATVCQAVSQGHHLESCNIFLILKTFMPSDVTSSKGKGEIKEKSILYCFPSLFFKQATSVASAFVLPCSSTAPSHLSPPESVLFTWDSQNLPQGTRLLLWNKFQELNKQYGQTQIQRMIPNFFWTVVNNNILTSLCLALSHQPEGACICEKQNTVLEGKQSPSEQVTVVCRVELLL